MCRYLLGELTPPPQSVVHALDALHGVASHSLTAAWKLAAEPGLLTSLVQR